jgi:chromosome segregation ATPase
MYITQAKCHSLEAVRKSSTDSNAGLLTELSKSHEELMRVRREADTLQASFAASQKARETLENELKSLRQKESEMQDIVKKLRAELDEERMTTRELSDKCKREETMSFAFREEVKTLEAQVRMRIQVCLDVCAFA